MCATNIKPLFKRRRYHKKLANHIISIQLTGPVYTRKSTSENAWQIFVRKAPYISGQVTLKCSISHRYKTGLIRKWDSQHCSVPPADLSDQDGI